MGKVGFLIKRIATLDYKNLMKTAGEVHEASGKSRISAFTDIVKCGMKYQAGYMDYKLFKMYELSDEERAKILTRGKNDAYVRRLNDKEYVGIFSDKAEFNKHFDKYLCREWILLDGNNEADFAKFIQNKEQIIVKPLCLCCGKGIEILDPRKYGIHELYEYLIKNQSYLVEEVVKQSAEISAIYPSSVNTIRIVTVLSDNNVPSIVGAYMRIGTGGNVVDNFNHGGITAPINIKTGKIEHKARNKSNVYFSNHPDTNAQILGFTIPNWSGLTDYAKSLALVMPKMRYVGWDICITEKGFAVIEANEYPGNDLYQIPKEDIGTANLIEDALKK